MDRPGRPTPHKDTKLFQPAMSIRTASQTRISIKTEAHTSPLDPRKMHPLIAAAYHNKTRSPLCRFPDAILVRIMQLSDNVTVECLRRCSRIFLRLFPDARASVKHFTTQLTDNHPWTSPKTEKWTKEEREVLKSMIERESYCKACRAAKNAPDYQSRIETLLNTYLHCSGCKADHPACLFSAGERERPQSERICIGHEGYVRLCMHSTVSWRQVVSAVAKRLRSETPEQRAFFACIQRCGENGHIRPCGDKQPFPRDPKSINKPAAPPQVHAKCCSPYPTLYVGFIPRGFEIVFRWCSHLPLSTKENGHFEAKEFEEGIQALYNHEGQFICPQIEPGKRIVIGRALCDPGRCDCLEYAGKDSTNWGRPLTAWREAKTCRDDPSLGLGDKTIERHTVQGTLPRVSTNSCCRHGRFSGNSDGFYLAEATVSRCSSDGEDCTSVSYRSAIGFVLDKSQSLERVNTHWYGHVDPDSYNVTEDVDGFGLYWCMSPACMNYYRFGSTRFKRLGERKDVQTCPT